MVSGIGTVHADAIDEPADEAPAPRRGADVQHELEAAAVHAVGGREQGRQALQAMIRPAEVSEAHRAGAALRARAPAGRCRSPRP